MAESSLRGLSVSRKRLLDAARGLLLLEHENAARGHRRILRSFPITENNVRSPPLKTPHDFHTALCLQITSAKRRVYLASLYVGPAANPSSSHREFELLTALKMSAAPNVKILLDKNRALRPVSVIQSDDTNIEGKVSTTISSAEACFFALEPKLSDQRKAASADDFQESGVFLLSVLPMWQQFLLRNPYNEVAGVFHLKCYIVDDDIILTGANLSEEYFCDRIDRYLWLTSRNSNDREINTDSIHKVQGDHSMNLVDFYAKLIDVLCGQAEPYTSKMTDEPFQYAPRTSPNELLENLIDVLTVDASTEDRKVHGKDEDNIFGKNSNITHSTDNPITSESDHPVVAYAVPTFQAPTGFLRALHKHVPRDTDIVASLIRTATERTESNTKTFQIRLASAYLNLTDDMIGVFRQGKETVIHLMTAGFASHGFKPNPRKVGNKGKAWIPAVFDALGRQNVEAMRKQNHICSDPDYEGKTNLWYYQREGWTFHAKGIWVTERANTDHLNGNVSVNGTTGSLRIEDATSMCAATHGSGNYGARSAICDMESNLILIFPDVRQEKSQLFLKMFQNDWNSMCEYAGTVESEKNQPLSYTLRILLPLIRPFF
jgi:CDP-diacylglycerol---glycerol-3-phosphate 3-phosphatidyltransferase